MSSSIEEEFRAKLARAPQVPLAGINCYAGPQGKEGPTGLEIEASASSGEGGINWSSSEKNEVNQMIGRARYKERLRQLKAQRGGKARHEARISKLTESASASSNTVASESVATANQDHHPSCGDECDHLHFSLTPADGVGAATKKDTETNAPTKAKYKRAQKKKRQLAKKKEAERAKKAEEADQRVYNVTGEGMGHERVEFHLDD